MRLLVPHRARIPTLYSQPLLSLFCEVENLDTEGFQLAGSLLQHSDLMRDRNVGKVRVDGFYNLIIVISQFLKLEVKVVQPRDELHFRGVAFDDDELFLEDAFDDKPAAVMFQSSFAKQFVEANVLLFIKPERVLMTRRWGLLSGLVGQFSVCIHNIGKKRVATWERPRPRRASTFVGQMPICRTKVQLARLK